MGNYVSLTAVDRLTEVLTICNAENPESRRELAISDLHVVRDLMKYLTFPTSGTGWDSARALLLLDELSMLETTSLGTDAAATSEQTPKQNASRLSSAGTGAGRHVLPVTPSREQRTSPGHAS